MTTQDPTAERVLDPQSELRQAAVKQLRKKRDFQAHALAYVLVNLLLNAIWLVTGPGAFYWPVIPLVGWGIGLAFNAWDVYSPAAWDEETIQREMARLRR